MQLQQLSAGHGALTAVRAGQGRDLVILHSLLADRTAFDPVLERLTAKHRVATPVNWKPGEDVIISSSVSDEAAKQKFPNGWKAPKPYIRIVPQPHA